MKFAGALLLVSLVGCHSYHRRLSQSGILYFMENRPTTFHGICAEVYGNDNEWELDHPVGHNAEGGSDRSEVLLFTTRDAAVAKAEALCPTGARP